MCLVVGVMFGRMLFLRLCLLFLLPVDDVVVVDGVGGPVKSLLLRLRYVLDVTAPDTTDLLRSLYQQQTSCIRWMLFVCMSVVIGLLMCYYWTSGYYRCGDPRLKWTAAYLSGAGGVCGVAAAVLIGVFSLSVAWFVSGLRRMKIKMSFAAQQQQHHQQQQQQQATTTSRWFVRVHVCVVGVVGIAVLSLPAVIFILAHTLPPDNIWGVQSTGSSELLRCCCRPRTQRCCRCLPVGVPSVLLCHQRRCYCLPGC